MTTWLVVAACALACACAAPQPRLWRDGTLLPMCPPGTILLQEMCLEPPEDDYVIRGEIAPDSHPVRRAKRLVGMFPNKHLGCPENHYPLPNGDCVSARVLSVPKDYADYMHDMLL